MTRPQNAKNEASAAGDLLAFERFFNEANLLRLEGRLFCFDPKEAGRRTSPVTFEKIQRQAIVIEPDPRYGYPSILAYKVLQAISKKLTEEGFPVPGTVSFSQRELARLVGRTTFGGSQSKELYRAVMQLHATRIRCSLYDKKTGEWATASFYLLYEALFSGRNSSITTCMVSVHPRIIESLNNRHYACLNWNRLMELEPIGMALYKRLFYHFSNLHVPRKRNNELKFEKDYGAMCNEWLGGLKPEKYRSKILQTQLGRHLNGLKHNRLIRKVEIVRKAADGLKLVFWPGKGFFDDYEEFYVKQWQPRLRFKQAAALRDIQQPLSLVAHFHELLGHSHRTFDEKEVAYASHLLESYPYEGVRDLIAYAVDAAKQTNFKMQFLGAIRPYVERWAADKEHLAAERRRREQIARCPLCDELGYVMFEKEGGQVVVQSCPHEAAWVATLEEQKGLRRVSGA